MSSERWATFDCYGTLIDWNGGLRQTLTRVFGEADADDLLDRYHQLEPLVESESYRPYREVLDTVLAKLAAERSRPLDDHEQHSLSRSLADWPAFSEVPGSLRELRRRGWNLCILSNCDRDQIAASLQHLHTSFDLVILAEDVHSYKPAHGHWDRFRAETTADPARHVHVAASLFHDVAPCDELGIRSVWVNRLGEAPGPVPTREIPDLSLLPDVLDELVAA